jgi:hypothetical protein
VSGKATTKRSRRSIHYLLSADRRLRRLSLKRLPARAGTARSSHRSAQPPAARRSRKPLPLPATNGTWIVLTLIAIVATAALIAAPQPAHRSEVASANVEAIAGAPTDTMLGRTDHPVVSTPAEKMPAASAAHAEKAAPAPGAITKQIVLPMMSEVGAIRTNTTEAKVTKKPPPESSARHEAEAAKAPAMAAPAAAPASTTTTPAVTNPPSAAKPEADAPAAVTISGCLESNDNAFRLKDTSGADAPKSRSWKSGFLMKRSASIRLVDAVNALKLPSHVGQRVSATGLLVDGEMHAHTLHSVAPSCR